MKIVSCSNMKNHFGLCLKLCLENDGVLIEKRGKIIAKMVPVNREDNAYDKLLGLGNNKYENIVFK